MGKKLFGFIFDFWEAVLSFLGIAIMAFGAIYPLWQDGHITLNWAIVGGTILFVIFGALAVAKGIRQGLELQRLQTLQQGTNNKVGGDGIAGQTVNRSPVAKNGGYASGGDMHITQNFFPSKKIESISLTTVDGKINVRHNSPKLDSGESELDFKFTIINETNKDFSKCAVYIDEISCKQQEDGQWEISNDLPSSRPLKWDTLFVDLEGKTDIGSGDRKSFILSNAQTRIHTREKVVYQYPLAFYKETTPLPNEKAMFHRLLMRFHGGQYFGAGINKKFYVYIREDGGKKYAGIEELVE